MHTSILKFLRDLRSSYWFIPSLMVVSAIVLAVVTDRIDAHISPGFLDRIPWLHINQPAGARAVLSAIATSMIGVAGVTFSMTIVSVSFAASNIGPRLINNFMRDTGNQVTLGTFIATFVYCLLVLRTVTDPSGESGSAYVPHVSLLVALALALLSVSNLIYFIHHIPESINVARIAYQVGDELRSAVTSLFQTDVDQERKQEPDIGSEMAQGEGKPVRALQSGYLQVVDYDALMTVACKNEQVVRLECRPGDFVLANGVLLNAHPGDGVDGDMAEKLAECFAFGSKRTAAQNPMFLVDQLVEIMMRALSPGVNDPFTAVSCLDWLKSSLAIIVQGREPDCRRYDTDGNLRIVDHALTLDRVACAVFEQPLQYVAANRIAALHMMQVIADLVAMCERPDYTKTLLKHAENLRDAGETCLPVLSDRELLALRYQQAAGRAVDAA